MINHDEIIKQVCRKNGLGEVNILNTSNFSDTSYIKIFENTFIKYVCNQNLNCIFKVIDDDSVNAFTFFDNGYDYLCVNIGTILHCIHVSYKVTEDEMCFPTIFESQDFVISGRKEKPKIVGNRIEIYSGTHDSFRQELTHLLVFFSISFICFHEIGHILDGHTRYLLDTCNIKILKTKSSQSINDSKLNIIYQSLEMDADSFAANRTIEWVVSRFESLSNAYPNVVTSKDVILKIWGYSISIVFYLIGLERIDMSNLFASQYLPNALRLIVCHGAAYSFIKTFYCETISQSQFDEIISNSFTECKAFFDQYMKDYSNKIIISKDEAKILGDFYDENIRPCWKALRPDLEKYAKFSLAKNGD